MAPPNPQPTLPAEGTYTETERLFIAEEPPNAFPENQHSNWGLLRRVLTDEIQIAVDDLNALFNELFIDTSSAYLSDWERELGLPVSSGLSDPARRTTLSSRKQRAPFTRTRVKSLVERYITDTFGSPAEFGAGGIALTGAGVPLYAEAGSVPTLYRVYEDVRGYAYIVRIKNSITPSAALLRELQWMTPAHITLTYDNSLANILNYGYEIRNKQPVGQWRMASAADASGYGNALTAFGGMVFGGSAALITSPDADASTTFDGVNDYATAPYFTLFDANPDEFTIGAWIKPTALPSAGNYLNIASRANNGWRFRVDSNGKLMLSKAGVADIVLSTTSLVAGNTYYVAATKKGNQTKLYINGVDRTGVVTDQTIEATGSVIYIGQRGDNTGWFNGVIDEMALYQQALSPSEILLNYNTGINVP